MKRAAGRRGGSRQEDAGGTKEGTKVFCAGCRRERPGPARELELAYTTLEYPECPSCPHRLEPEDAPSFCRWLPLSTPHPFAALAGLEGLE